MKNFIRACLIAALVFVVAGIVLLVVAAAGGVTRASLRLFSDQERLKFGPVSIRLHDGWSVNIRDNRAEYLDDFVVKEDDSVLFQNNVYTVKGPVSELYVDVNAGDFTLLPSEDEYFYMECDDEDIRVDYTGGRLTVECIGDIDLIQIGFYEFEQVTVYIPTGLTFDKVAIDVGAGNVDIGVPLTAAHMELDVDAGNITVDDAIEADYLSLDVDAGNLDAYDQMTVTTRLAMDVDAGNIYVEELDCSGIAEADCDMGNLELSGNVYNDFSVDCGAGSVTLDFVGNGQNYNYALELGVGDITINGDSFSGINKDIILQGDHGAPTISLSCDAGDIEVDIH